MGNVTAKVSGEIASFMSPSVTNIKSLKVHFSPKQLGTGDPSPENVRGIEGWDDVDGYSANENLWSNDYYTQCNKPLSIITDSENIYYGFYTGSIASWADSIGYIPVNNIDGKRLTISADIGASDTFTFRFYFQYSDGTVGYISNISAKPNEIIRVSRTSTSGKKVIGYRIDTSAGVTNYRGRISNIMVSWDNEKKYIKPNTKKISANWASDIGTIYGGYVDLISGELVEEYGCVKLEDLNWTAKDNRTRTDDLSSSILPPSYSVMVNIIGEQVQPASYSMNLTNYPNAIACSSNGQLIKYYDGENPQGLMAYQLKTPITHQLTPTQLQSFVGQNNFWSNADYVEVEYDLIETEDIQKAKQKIILNQPQLKTVSDKVVSFNTDMVAPMKNCKIYFNPIQLGSGNPSFTNVRDINGWTRLDSYVNGDKVSIDWTSDAGTVYGGYLDLAKNEVVAEWIKFVFNRSSTVSASGTSSLVEGLTWMTLRKTISSTPPYMATPNNGDLYGLFTIGDWQKAAVGGRNRAFVNSKNLDVVLVSINGEDLTTSDGRDAFFDYIENQNIPIECIYKLKSPIHYTLSSLTSQQLLTLKSTNHIWSETNGQQIDVTYWTRKNLTPTPLVNYLENQTWSSNGYISATGKQTPDANSASHYLASPILLEAGTYVLSGFSHYVGSDNTRYRIHAYDSTGTWLKQITFQQIGNLSPVDINFTLDTDTYVNVSIARDFDGVLAKIN